MGIVFTLLFFVPLFAILVGVLFMVAFRRHALLEKGSQWLSRPGFQSPLYGGLIFLFNAVVFGATLLIVFGAVMLASELGLPAPMMLFAPLAVAVSGIGWILFGRSWQGSVSGRIVAALIGSIFYWLLFAYGYYEIELLRDKPENSMSDVGFLMLMFISFIAAITCIVMAGWPRNAKKKRL